MAAQQFIHSSFSAPSLPPPPPPPPQPPISSVQSADNQSSPAPATTTTPIVSAVLSQERIQSLLNSIDTGSITGPVGGSRLRRHGTDTNQLHTWIADVFSMRRERSLFDASSTSGASTLLDAIKEHGTSGESLATLARVPSLGGWRHFLVISSFIPINTSYSSAPNQTREGLVRVFQLDDLLLTAAQCQEAMDEADIDGPIPSEEPRRFALRLSALPQVSAINCGFEITRMVSHPTNEALFVACNPQSCVVVGLSVLGQACGRVNIIPVFESKDEIIIKAMWLPYSTRFIALLTTKSVQVSLVLRGPSVFFDENCCVLDLDKSHFLSSLIYSVLIEQDEFYII